jgi:chemotaxis protein methyltransferase CheR
MTSEEVIEDIEFSLLLEGIFQRYGYDFRRYAQKSLKRRIKTIIAQEEFPHIGDLLGHCLRNPEFFYRVMPAFTVSTTSMFRDPGFFKSLRQHICPWLHTYPRITVWHAGCSTGEEVYSLAIILKEEGLYDRSTIFASDINPTVLSTAQQGVYPAQKIKEYTASYQQSGGKQSFSDYYTAQYGRARMNRSLLDHVTFTEHNLATDRALTNAQLILCRNVFIYFDRSLQEKAAQLFLNSLVYKGLLCLGNAESIRFLSCSDFFDDFDESHRIYQKNAGTRPPLLKT